MSYYYYCLAETTSKQSSMTTTRFHSALKNLELTMKYFKISGEYPIFIFNFLSHLAEDPNTLDMSER